SWLWSSSSCQVWAVWLLRSGFRKKLEQISKLSQGVAATFCGEFCISRHFNELNCGKVGRISGARNLLHASGVRLFGSWRPLCATYVTHRIELKNICGHVDRRSQPG